MPKTKFRSRIEWTPQEIQFLKENYPTTKGSKIAKMLGKTNAAVYTKASDLKIGKEAVSPRKVTCVENSQAPRWTVSEVEFLKKNAGKMTDREIGNRLGKSASAVACKRRSFKTVKYFQAAAEDRVEKSGKKEVEVKNQFKVWTKKDEKTLKTKFNSIPVQDLAEELGRTVSSINTRARALGLVPAESVIQRASWSDEEINYLKKNINKKSFEEIGQYLGRSAASVQCKASVLKIKKAFPMRKAPAINIEKIAMVSSITLNVGLLAYLFYLIVS